MDEPCSFEQLRGCLRDIARVNRMTGAYRPTLEWLDQVYRTIPVQRRSLHIVDVGCGYGDMLRRIHGWAQERQIAVKLTGIDLNADAVRAAREATTPGTVTYLSGNAFDFRPEGGIDLIISSLLMHHLEDAAIAAFLVWMEATARVGWFVNDLERQPVPYHFFRWFVRFTRFHPFVKHDGPTSILRSFRAEDWKRLLRMGGIPAEEVQVRRYRPARMCLARLRERLESQAGVYG